MALIPTKKIPQLTTYGVPLGGTEQLEIWSVNTSRRITARDFVLPIDSILTITDMGSVLPASRQLVSSPTVQVTDNGAGGTVTLDALFTGAFPGNPTASIGLTPVNGVAVTWMRSDAAPPLSQAIIPTWSALHTFGAGLIAASNDPFLRISESDAAANNRVWDFTAVGEQFRGRVGNDALGAFTNWIEIDRTANVVDTINLLATTASVNGQNIRDAAILTSGLVATARLGTGVADATSWLRGDQTWQVLPGGFTGFANPTASVGLTTVNGAATTAMRSDGAPALDQAIAPTWTAQHIFSLSGATNAAILASSAQPQADWNETDAAANNRRWRWGAQGEQFLGQVVNDANSAAVSWIVVDRTANTIDTIALVSTSLTWNGSPLLSAGTAFANPTGTIGLSAVNGAATTALRSDGAPALSQAIAPTWTAQHIFSLTGATNAAIFASSAQPQVDWNETDAAANNRRWRWEAQGEAFLGRVVDDANSAAVSWLEVNRTANTVDSVAFPATAARSHLIGTTSPATNFNALVHIAAAASQHGITSITQTVNFAPLIAWNQATAGDNLFVVFETEGTGAAADRGTISYNRGAGLTSYNTTSDQRRKKNIRDAPEASSILDAIQIRAFEWIDSNTPLSHWVIAQELYQICPWAVSQGNDTRDWAVDTSKLVPLMIKEMQSMRRRLTALETPGNSNRAN